MTPEVAWLVEVKSTRASLAAQRSFQDYLDLLMRDVGGAFEQLATTAKLIRASHPALGLVPPHLPLAGAVVTAEPMYHANTTDFRKHFTDPTIPTSILSMREFEDAIAYALVLPVDQVVLDLVKPGAGGQPNPRKALADMERNLGEPARNPMLDEAWAAGQWREATNS